MIYLDHNATTPLHPQALAAMLPYLGAAFANPSSPYRAGYEVRRAVERARGQVAAALGCRPGEVVFCASGTEANNLALRGVTAALGARGRHIVTSAIEHPAVLNTCRALEAAGCRLTTVAVTSAGVVDLAALAASLTPDTGLVSVMHANNETGVVQPIAEIAALTRPRGILLHTDAVQTAGKVPGDLATLGADLVTLSAHKLYGPKGAAALYVRRGTPLVAILTGGGHEGGRRAGTENVAAIVGFGEAATLAAAAVVAEAPRLAALRDAFEAELLARVPGVTVHGASAPRVANTTSLGFADIDGESVVLALDVAGISVATGSACSTGEPEPSHVLRAMGVTPRLAQGTVRLSLGRETGAGDIAATVETLAAAVARLRRISSAG